MPDLRTLLEETTARPASHPDPVAAVHRTVRRRARRHVVAGAALSVALVATGAAALRLGPDDAAPATTSDDAGYDTRWRYMTDAYFILHSDTDELERVRRLIDEHPDVFFIVRAGTVGGASEFTVVFSADADPDDWMDELRDAAGDVPVRVHRCDRTTAYLDRAATDVVSARFPSGARVMQDAMYPFGWRVSVDFPCTVVAVLDRDPVPSDDEYVRSRWGDSVVVRSAT